jgi:LuxR family transcriptional regulator, maltose regulon positive regulatory protein
VQDRSYARALEGGRQAIELAERHGWTDDPAAGVACVSLGSVLAWQGRPEEAEPWLGRAERTLREEPEPAAVVALHIVRGELELARNRDAEPLAALRVAERLVPRIASPHRTVPANRALLLRALDFAEPNGLMTPFLSYAAPGLLESHARQSTAHASLVAEIRSRLDGNRPAPPATEQRPTLEPLTDSELRVLRYLPTNLTAPEIARELYVSQNTVKTHLRNLYSKLGTHRRGEAVESARALSLLAPSGSGRQSPAAPPVQLARAWVSARLSHEWRAPNGR